MEWQTRSRRLWVAEHHGRTFRIEKTGDALAPGGSLLVREVDRLQREVRREFAKNFPAAQKVADEWAEADAA